MNNLSPLAETVQNFLVFCREKGLSEKTLLLHNKNLCDYLVYCNENSISYVEQQTSLLINTYIVRNLENTNDTDLESIRRSIRVFNSWFKKTTRFPFKHPGPRIRFRHRNGTSKDGISRIKVNKVIQTCGHDLIGSRDSAIIAVLEETGIHPLELCNLNFEDYFAKTSMIRIKSAKSFASREMRLGLKSNKFLQKYLRVRGIISVGFPLFSKANGNPLVVSDLYSILRRRSHEANVYPPITPGALRYSFGLEAYLKSHDLAHLKQLMGYKVIPKAIDFSGFLIDDLMRAIEDHRHSWDH